MKLVDRIAIARQAIIELRKEGVNSFSLGPMAPKAERIGNVAYGCVGLLDYIETGDPHKILEIHLRDRVDKIIALVSRGG